MDGTVTSVCFEATGVEPLAVNESSIESYYSIIPSCGVQATAPALNTNVFYSKR